MNRLAVALLGLILVLIPATVHAHAVTGTLVYSVTSGGGTISCDIGPPYTGPTGLPGSDPKGRPGRPG